MSRRVSGGLRVRFVPGMCVSFSSSRKSAWVVFVCANFVRMQFPVKVSACFVVLPAWGSKYVLSIVSVPRVLLGSVVLVCSGSRWGVRRVFVVFIVSIHCAGSMVSVSVFQIDLGCGVG